MIEVFPTRPHPGGNNPPTLSNVERVPSFLSRCKYDAFTLSASERVRLTMQFVVSLG